MGCSLPCTQSITGTIELWYLADEIAHPLDPQPAAEDALPTPVTGAGASSGLQPPADEAPAR